MSPSLGMESFSSHGLLGELYLAWQSHPHAPPENAGVTEIMPASCATTKEQGKIQKFQGAFLSKDPFTCEISHIWATYTKMRKK